MVSTQFIRNKIYSIRNTQKITKAMEMVAVSKMKKTQEQMMLSRPYSKLIRKVINNIILSNLEYKHPFFKKRNISNIGYIILSTDRGLIGGLNINLFKIILDDMLKWKKNKVLCKLFLIGNKSISFFNSLNVEIISQTANFSEKPLISDIIGTVKTVINEYENNCLDKIYIAYNKFINTMVQHPKIFQLLPLINDNNTKKNNWDYIYEPDSKEILELLIQRYLESQVYQGVVENLASEQAARMITMKSATDNAGNIIEELQLIYNKVRQNGITQELTEIISGASAV